MAIMNEFACFDFKEKLKLYALKGGVPSAESSRPVRGLGEGC